MASLSNLSNTSLTTELCLETFEEGEFCFDGAGLWERAAGPAGLLGDLLDTLRELFSSARYGERRGHGQLQLLTELLGDAPGCEAVHVHLLVLLWLEFC